MVTSAIGPNASSALDLLRAIAANLVLVGHACDIFGLESRISVGQIGVGIFFLLSGFLILQSSLMRLHRPGPYFMPYLIDRFARIFTAYLPVLILVFLVNVWVDVGHWGQPGTSTGPAALVGNAVLLQDYPIFQLMHRVFGDGIYIRAYNTAEPFWTIPIEFWIYVAFGLAFFAATTNERLGSLAATALLAIALPVVGWNAAAGGGNGLTEVWLLGAVSGYLWVSALHQSRSKMSIGMVMLIAGLVCLVGRGLKLGWSFQDLGVVLCEVLILLGIISMMEGVGSMPRIFHRISGFLAAYSYSLYLVHNTVLILIRHFYGSAPTVLLLALLASHIAAFLVYILFERHYRHVGASLKQWLAFRPVRVRA